MIAKERDERETLCPRCGTEAVWSYVDAQKSQVEVRCPECGRHTMSREEYDRAAAEHPEMNEPDPRA